MATKEAFFCILKAVSVGEPEKEWESDGIRYIWGMRFEYVVSGDLIGTMVSVVNGKSDPSTGDGVAFGDSVLKVEDSRWGPGTFELRWTCNVRSEMIVSGEIIGKGSKEFTGWKLIGSVHDVEPHTRQVEGFILNHHG